MDDDVMVPKQRVLNIAQEQDARKLVQFIRGYPYAVGVAKSIGAAIRAAMIEV